MPTTSTEAYVQCGEQVRIDDGHFVTQANWVDDEGNVEGPIWVYSWDRGLEDVIDSFTSRAKAMAYATDYATESMVDSLADRMSKLDLERLQLVQALIDSWG